jgi:dephospho-CoA kinase
MLRIAITGGVAEGKSTVLQMLAEEGWRVQSSDHVAKRLFESPEVIGVVAQAAGLRPDFSRSELRDAILGSDQTRRAVNRVLHPRISAENAQVEASFFEVPLLFEACLHTSYDRVWVVTCGTAEQHRRLASRLGDSNLAERMIASQLPTFAKTLFADIIIRTNQNFETVRSMLREAAPREIL